MPTWARAERSTGKRIGGDRVWIQAVRVYGCTAHVRAYDNEAQVVTQIEQESVARYAIHEAAHAAVASYFAHVEGAQALRVASVSITPGPTTRGAMLYTTNGGPVPERYVDLFVITTFAGDCAVRIWAAQGQSVTFTPARLERRFRALKSIEESEDRAGRVRHDDDYAASLVAGTTHSTEDLRRKATGLLGYLPIRSAVDAIATALLDRAELTGSEVGQLFGQEWHSHHGTRLLARAFMGAD